MKERMTRGLVNDGLGQERLDCADKDIADYYDNNNNNYYYFRF